MEKFTKKYTLNNMKKYIKCIIKILIRQDLWSCFVVLNETLLKSF